MGCRNKGIFDTILNFKYFIQAVKFWWPTQNIPLPHNFLSFSCGPLETCCGLLGVYKAKFETHYTITRQFFLSEAKFSTRPHSISWKPVSILSSSLCLGCPNAPFPQVFTLCITKSQEYSWSMPVHDIANHMSENFNRHNWTVCSAKN